MNKEGEMRRTSAVACSLNLYFHRPYSRICSSGTGDLTVAEAFRATLPLSSSVPFHPGLYCTVRISEKERGRDPVCLFVLPSNHLRLVLAPSSTTISLLPSPLSDKSSWCSYGPVQRDGTSTFP